MAQKLANHVVLPVSHVITNLLTEDGIPLIVRVEVHVVGIDIARTLVIHNDCRACRPVGLTISVWLHSSEP